MRLTILWDLHLKGQELKNQGETFLVYISSRMKYKSDGKINL